MTHEIRTLLLSNSASLKVHNNELNRMMMLFSARNGA